ncbi:aminotransferase class I/II-fold pyridoxal phosphate-dependent enzyme [Staphylococcus pseudoxylosus]|uniref:aminotransferase class I/II-fold pyridoxal phosphate-dependent enzyme n=1 Tax=Staphylococcus pseudoxylosus TaxID=2282419 RepID=UPI002DBF67AF|nr:aminotransferase class I/II-fold pyridoxal phosphate-dependent enzyme [Staphylococcus pseudoxylosus]MEB6036959.1 aminotransferase class I/II-fold pyridoxal phosphate-dependent enzyme [Staphylococcus pseudoxylosus]MEB6044105.1 aminotransferase class I/II-fold pyridoxal phosphate-dependent enzyme [Staphylococcus pseudoxylosus]MEB7764554.1 aminotransferase class I/II-fold pyridoxal phosphate-dependent enzyme [Staphylococcus pseudoxylosus]MEB8009473.1 aminotransferase class I/II-fold pyridoxal p
MAISDRLAQIPDSYFAKTMGQKVEHGPLPLINMAVGIPDGETPKGIIDCFADALRQPDNQKYVAFHGKDSFKQAIVDFYQRQFQVALDKEDEVCILYGTKNGLVGLPTCIVNPGENVLLPDPGYTDYKAGVLLADAQPQPLVLEPPYYLPQWDKISKKTLLNTRLVYLTYPNNPTGSVATKSIFEEAVERFKGTKTKIVHDFAYSAFGFDAKNPSILQAEGAKDLAIEIFSLSKGYNMSGFRVGFAVGNKDIIQALKKYQSHTHAGMFGALQDAATYALNNYDDFLDEQNLTFKRRRDEFEAKLQQANIPFEPMKGGIFLWLRTPKNFDGESFVDYLLQEQSILVAPGIPFGEHGKHYVRISLALDDASLLEAAERIQSLKHLYE